MPRSLKRYGGFRAVRKRKKILVFALCAVLVAAGIFFMPKLIQSYQNRQMLKAPTPTPNPLDALAEPSPTPKEAQEVVVIAQQKAKINLDAFAYVGNKRTNLSCVQEIVYTNNQPIPLDAIYLRILPNALMDTNYMPFPADNFVSNGGQLEFRLVSINGSNAQYELSGKYKTSMKLALSEPLRQAEQLKILLDYSFLLPEAEFYLGSSGKSAQFGYFCATPAVYQSTSEVYCDSDWQLTNIALTGAPWYIPLADYTATIHVPTSLDFASTGEVSSFYVEDSDTVYCITAENARDFAFTIGPKGRTFSAEVNRAKLTAYATTAEKAKRIVTAAQEVLKSYSPLPGEYEGELELFATRIAAESLAQSGLVLINASTVNTDGEELSFLLARAIAQQWLGIKIADESGLNGLLCDYLAAMHIENNFDKAAADAAFAKNEGAKALRQLRIDIGAKEFDGAIATYLSSSDRGDRDAFVAAFADTSAIEKILNQYAQ